MTGPAWNVEEFGLLMGSRTVHPYLDREAAERAMADLAVLQVEARLVSRIVFASPWTPAVATSATPTAQPGPGGTTTPPRPQQGAEGVGS